MKEIALKQYVVDAFTDEVFKGNPAAVCVLTEWIPDTLMQNIAKENNLSETAFTVKKGSEYELRWFTPGGEIDLCGHATLGTAYVLLRFVEKNCDKISFQTKSGLLIVKKEHDLYEMDMPAYQLKKVPVTDEMEQAIGSRPVEAWMGRDLVCVMADEKEVLQAAPDEEKLKKLDVPKNIKRFDNSFCWEKNKLRKIIIRTKNIKKGDFSYFSEKCTAYVRSKKVKKQLRKFKFKGKIVVKKNL